MTTIVLVQFFQAWNCRSEYESVFRVGWTRNPYMIYATIAVFFAHIAAIYVPIMQRIFQTAPLTSAEWLRALPVALSALVVVEAHKWWYRRRTVA
jgi:magnesium-transporting ATPase (P-type)